VDPGAGVDAAGNPVLDPTKNVLDLVEAAIKRQDDLRAQEVIHAREIGDLRHMYEKELREAESARLDSIRAVDQAAVQRTAEVQAAQAAALATQVVATADAFRATLATALEPIQKDIADLRKTQYEQAGQRAQVTEGRDVRGSNLGIIYGAIGASVGLIALIFSFMNR